MSKEDFFDLVNSVGACKVLSDKSFIMKKLEKFYASLDNSSAALTCFSFLYRYDEDNCHYVRTVESIQISVIILGVKAINELA